MHRKVIQQAGSPTARSRIVAILTDEILNNAETEALPLESEVQLCIRFNVSRVTVRHALSDLEHRGLIYRKRGKGTFAYGHSTRVHGNIAILFKSPGLAEEKFIADLIRGAQTVTASLRSALVLVSASPCEWRPNVISSLAGVIVIPKEITANELETLRNHKLCYVSIGNWHLFPADDIGASSGSSIFHVGRQAAEILSRAAMTGESLHGFNMNADSLERTELERCSYAPKKSSGEVEI
jgi:DNA-binding transcriptional regulator YhcF (GntR family)